MDKINFIKNNVLYNIIKLWEVIGGKYRGLLSLLLLLMLISAVFEAFTLVLLSPFLSSLAGGGSGGVKSGMYFDISKYMPANLAGSEFLYQTLMLVLFLLLSALIKIMLVNINANLSYSMGTYLSKKVFHNILHKSYLFHTTNNSAELSFLISAKVNSIPYNIILPLLNIFSGLITATFILVFLLVMNPIIGSLALSGFLIIYAGIYFTIFKRLQYHSKNLAELTGKIAKLLNDGLGSIRDIKLSSLENFYSNLFESEDRKLKDSYIRVALATNIPKYSIETLSMCLICLIGYFFSSGDGIAIISSLGVLILASYKLLPVLQQIYAGCVTIIASNIVLSDVMTPLLSNPINDSGSQLERLVFSKSMVLKNIQFGYTKSKKVISSLDLEINKGDIIGLVGESGSGKSTLLDIIMGLIKPDNGDIYIDGNKCTNSYYSKYKIGHVPQSVFIADLSIVENITFGASSEEIDYQRVKDIAKMVYLDEFIEGLPKKYNHPVGERGVSLSGGQVQRLGIARAIYTNPDILIIDEGTSALDNETEEKIIQTLLHLSNNSTLILATHRLDVLKICNKVYRVEDGNLVQFNLNH